MYIPEARLRGINPGTIGVLSGTPKVSRVFKSFLSQNIKLTASACELNNLSRDGRLTRAPIADPILPQL